MCISTWPSLLFDQNATSQKLCPIDQRVMIKCENKRDLVKEYKRSYFFNWTFKEFTFKTGIGFKCF
jgi:hypothetical protein